MTDWREVALGDVIDIFDHQRVPLSSAQRADRQGPYAYYGAQGVIDRIDDFIFDGRFILIPEDGENLRSRKLPIAYFAEGQFWVNNHAHIVKAKPSVANDRFIQSALQASDIGPFVTGAAQPKLSQANLRQIPMLLPSPKEQQVIADVLDALDELMENTRRRIDLLEQMAQAIYREWFVDLHYPGHEDDHLVDSDLGSIPAGWEASRTGELVAAGLLEIGDGYRAKNAEMSDSGLPFVRVASVRDGWLDLTGCDHLPLSYAERLKGKASQPADTVVCMKGTVGRSAFVHAAMPPLAYSPQVSYWRSRDHRALTPGYIYSWIRSEEFRRQCGAVKGATDMADYVNLKDQRRMQLIRPSAAVMSTFDACVEPMIRSGGTLRSQIDGLAATRDLLLPKLVTGAIDVSDLDLDALVEAAEA